jgi:hypothetical protein
MSDESTLQALAAKFVLVHRHTLIHILFIGTYGFAVLSIHLCYSLEKYSENAVNNGFFNVQMQAKDLLHKSRASLANPPSPTKEQHALHTRVKSTNSTKEGLSACLLVKAATAAFCHEVYGNFQEEGQIMGIADSMNMLH